MTIDGVILNSSIFCLSISPFAAVVFGILCFKTKNKKIIWLSILPGIFAFFSLVLLIGHILRSGMFDWLFR
jgi:hypothetical protein